MREMTKLSNHISMVTLDDEEDVRVFIWGSGAFSSHAAYRCLTESSVEDRNCCAIWTLHVSAKVKFFDCILCNDRLRTRSNLLHKKCLQPDEVFCLRCPSVIEDTQHLFYNCSPATATWTCFGISPNSTSTETLWCLDGPQGLLADVRNDILLLVHWRIWTARNNRVFNAHDDDSSAILRVVVDDLENWRYRYKQGK